MAEYVQRVGEQPSELLVEEWNLLSAIYKNAVGNRRAAWRVITSVEQKEASKGDEKLVSNAREYVEKVESELQKIRDGILALMDKNLVPSPSTDETKVSYYKMKSDYYRYLVEQVTEVPKTSNCDRTSQRAVEQIFDVPVPEMVKQLLEVPETVSQDRIKQRTVEQIVDAPVPQVVEELAESFKVFSQDRIQQRAVEQIIENPANSVAEMTVEVPVIQTPERMQQLVNAHVQHVVNTVEVEKPKLVKLTVQRKKPIIQEKINQVTEQVEVPHVQFLTKVDDMPVVVQRQVSTDQAVQKAMEVPLLQFTDKVVDNPVVAQRQIPVMVQTIQKTTDIPQLQCIDKVIDIPVVSVVQAPQVQVSEKTVEISQLQAAEKFVETPRDSDDPGHPDL